MHSLNTFFLPTKIPCISDPMRLIFLLAPVVNAFWWRKPADASTAATEALFGSKRTSSIGAEVSAEFFNLPCHQKPKTELEIALCHILDATKSCGGVDPSNLHIINSTKLCSTDCEDKLGMLFLQEADLDGTRAVNMTTTQTEILNAIMTTVTQGYCESCRALCWQFNFGFF